MIRRVLACVGVVALGAAVLPATAAGAASGAPRSGEAVHVRTVPARELGLAAPMDVVAMPEHEAFLVHGEIDGGVGTIAVPDDWDIQDPVAAQATEAADDYEPRGRTDRVRAVHPRDGLEYRLDGRARLVASDGAGQPVADYDLSAADLVSPGAIAFAPSSDITDEEDRVHLFVADAGDATWSGGITEIRLLDESPVTRSTDGGPTTLSTLAAATTVQAQILQVVDASAWSPPSSDASGVAWDPARGEFLVVDSEINEISAFDDVNLWRVDTDGAVRSTGATTGPLSAGFSDEPTGVGLRNATRTMFITDDTGDNSVYVVAAGSDGVLGSTDDQVDAISVEAVASDPEDPDYADAEGVLYYLSGSDLEVHRIDPVDGVFGNGDDAWSSFDISHLGPTDFEGLAVAQNRGTLYVGARTTEQIFELTTTGTLLRTIEVPDTSDYKFISGLAIAPSSENPAELSMWFVDRAVDEAMDARLIEITFSSIDDPGGGGSNGPPVAVDDAVTTDEDTAVAVAVLANDTDPDGDALTPVIGTGPGEGSVQVNADGTVTYTPDADFNGSDSFTYRASDGSATSDVATVSVTVSAVNDAPVAADDVAGTLQDTAVDVDVLANDSDVDGDALSVTGLGVPSAGGTVSVNGDGTVRYTPATGFVGSETFTYRATDGDLESPDATVTVNVGNTNDPPVAVDDSVTTDEDTAVAVAVLANDTDPDGDALTPVIGTGPGEGSVQVNADGTVTYTPDADFNGSDSFTYRASDGLATSDVATVSVTVSAVNDAPVAADDGASTAEETPVNIAVLANDSDAEGQAVSLAGVTQPANGTAAMEADGTVTYTPVTDFFGTDTFTYQATDGAHTSAPATVTVTVTNVNDAPVASPDSAVAEEAVPVELDVLANDADVDGDALTIVLVTAPTSGTAVVSADGSKVTYTSDAGFAAVDSFTYRASDGTATSAAVTVTVSVDARPVAVDDSTTTPQGQAVDIAVLANDTDADGDVLEVVDLTAPTIGTAVLEADGTVTYTPPITFTGTATFTYRASDGTFTSAPATVTVAIDDTQLLSFPFAEETVNGSIADGDLTRLVEADGSAEMLAEEHSGGQPRQRVSLLEHQWSIDVQHGDQVTVEAVASRTDSGEGDDFRFEYSFDGGIVFDPLFTVAASTPTSYVAAIPAGFTGTAIVRVVDTDRSPGSGAIDEVHIDQLLVRVAAPQAALPVVEVTASDPDAAEPGDDGAFTVSRDTTTGDLVVQLAATGTATAGVDYVALPATVTIPDGSSSVVVPVAVLDDAEVEGIETVVVTVISGPEYTIGASGEAGLQIIDDEQQASMDLLPDSQVTRYGSVLAGDFGSLAFDDGDMQTLEEEAHKGGKATRLEHRWVFDVGTTALPAVLHLEAFCSDVEDFDFAYSLDGGNTWTTVVTATPSTSEVLHEIDLGTVSGEVQVRVRDTDSSREPVLDTVSIDRLFLRVG